MTTNSMEREVKLWNLLKRLAFRWKRILIGAVCIAVLGCAAKYLTDINNYEKTKSDISEMELQQAEEVARRGKELEACEAYLENSWLMQVNPFAIPVLSMEFAVDTGGLTEETANAREMYVYYVTSGQLAQDIVDSGWNGMTEQLLQEVLTCNVSVSNSSIFTIEIEGVTEELNEQLSGRIYEQLQAYQNREELLSQAALKQLGIVESMRTDYNLYTDRLDQKTLIEEEQLAYKSAFSALSDKQKKYLGYPVPEKVKPESFTIYIVVFGVMGLLVMMIIEVLGYLFSAKLQEKEELEENCGLTFLGIIESKSIDDGIEKISENLSGCLKMHGTNAEMALLSVGAADKIIQECIQKLREGNNNLSDMGNILDDFSKQEKVLKIGQAVLVEREGVSDYQDIVREVQQLLKNNIKLLGYVYVR